MYFLLIKVIAAYCVEADLVPEETLTSVVHPAEHWKVGMIHLSQHFDLVPDHFFLDIIGILLVKELHDGQPEGSDSIDSIGLLVAKLANFREFTRA